ncbi:MAG TPA: response regulator, partial [Pirellulales bacterium]|nr:response regulator [Pirellulales bacterium]
MSTTTVDLLLVDDDDEFRSLLVRRFKQRGYQVQDTGDPAEGLAMAERRQFAVAVIDMVMPGLSGIELLDKLKASHPECEVILLTGQGSIETAVQAMKLGAYDYLTKPCSLAELEVLVEKAVDRGRLSKENRQLKEMLKRDERPRNMIGQSAAMQEVFHLIARAGKTDKAILIQG